MGDVTLTHEDAQRIFDLALGMDQACSGYMESEDVALMRRLAEALGVDPAVATPWEYASQYPHDYVEPPGYIKDRARPMVASLLSRGRGVIAMPDHTYVPEGGWPCHASGRCGRPREHEIHG